MIQWDPNRYNGDVFQAKIDKLNQESMISQLSRMAT